MISLTSTPVRRAEAGIKRQNPDCIRPGASFPAIVWLAAALTHLTCVGVQAEPVDDLIQQGDAAAEKLQTAEALTFYLPAEKQKPQRVALLVRIARQYRHLMGDATTREEKLRYGALALDYSKRAAALGPEDSDAQLSVAITCGKLLPLQSSKEQTEASRRIKETAEKAIKLDPHNDLAWHVLGRWHQVVADLGVVKRTLGPLLYGKLPTATHEDAVKCFEQAIKLNPHRLTHYIELGCTYAQMQRGDEARKFISKGLAMPAMEKDDAGQKCRGRECLAKLP